MYRFSLLLTLVLAACTSPSSQPNTPVEVVRETLLVDHYQLPAFYPFSDENSSVRLTHRYLPPDDPLALPGQDQTLPVLQADFAVREGGYGGFVRYYCQRTFPSSEDCPRAPQYWRSYQGVRLWLYGNNTGKELLLIILDGRQEEHWAYPILDNYSGWRLFHIDFHRFQRRSDYQPEGAPNDGLNLVEVPGYTLQFPSGTGTTYLADLRLYDAQQTWLLDDYTRPNLFVFNSPEASAELKNLRLWPDDPEALPGQAGPVWVLRFDYSIPQGSQSFAGFIRAYWDWPNDAYSYQNWRGYKGVQLWVYGGPVKLSLLDGPDGRTAEQWFYDIPARSGWRQWIIPFAAFQRRADYQPEGAPDDGFNRTAISGYSISPASGTQGRLYLADFQLYR